MICPDHGDFHVLGCFGCGNEGFNIHTMTSVAVTSSEIHQNPLTIESIQEIKKELEAFEKHPAIRTLVVSPKVYAWVDSVAVQPEKGSGVWFAIQIVRSEYLKDFEMIGFDKDGNLIYSN